MENDHSRTRNKDPNPKFENDMADPDPKFARHLDSRSKSETDLVNNKSETKSKPNLKSKLEQPR